MSPRLRRLIVWFFCTLVAGVIPLGFIYAELLQKREAHAVSDVLSSGELILVSGVLALGSVGELIGEKAGNAEDSDRDGDVKLAILIATLMLLASTGWLYPVVRSSGGTVAVVWSLIAFGVSFLVGASSVWVSSRYQAGE